METNYKWIVYLTTNLVNKKIYVGVHKTLTPDVFDGYIGCGINIHQPYTYKHPKTYFQYAVKKYGTDKFIRQTIQIFDDAESAYDLEYYIVNEEFLKRTDVYNMILGGEYMIPPKVKVFQYDCLGNFIKEYSSIKEAADSNNVTHGAIQHAIYSKQKSCNSFWSTDKMKCLDISLYNQGNNHKVPVYIYDCIGNFIKTYNSEMECAKKLNLHLSTIHQALLFGCVINSRYKISTVLANTYSEANTIYTLNRTIYQYDSDGKYLQEFKQIDAIKQFPKNNLNKAIISKKPDKYGYIWALVKVPKYFAKTKGRTNSKKRVGKYTLNGELVKLYDSATAAAKENGTSVWKVLNGTNKTQKGHIYKYII